MVVKLGSTDVQPRMSRNQRPVLVETNAHEIPNVMSVARTNTRVMSCLFTNRL